MSRQSLLSICRLGKLSFFFSLSPLIAAEAIHVDGNFLAIGRQVGVALGHLHVGMAHQLRESVDVDSCYGQKDLSTNNDRLAYQTVMPDCIMQFGIMPNLFGLRQV